MADFRSRRRGRPGQARCNDECELADVYMCIVLPQKDNVAQSVGLP
jgi:hypothetical protein